MIGSIGVNLEMQSYWSRGLLYADAMLSAQAFYQGSDPAGNPVNNDEVILVFSAGTPAWGGTYKYVAQGSGQITPMANASYVHVANVTFNSATGTTTADLTISGTELQQLPQIGLRFHEDGAKFDAHNIQLWRPGANIGDLFYKPFTDLLTPFSCLRFMDVLKTNNSTQATWDARALPTDRNFSNKGVPLEHCVSLCKQTGKNGWIELPFLVAANPIERKKFAAWLAATVPLGSAQWQAVEVSNEDWNSMFTQWKQDQAAGAADPSIKWDGMGDPNILGWREYAAICVGLSKDIMAAYGVTDWRQTPIRPILGCQSGSTEVLKYEIEEVVKQFGPLATYFFAAAEAPYVQPDWNKPTDTPANVVAALQTAYPKGPNTLQIDAWCKANNLHHLAYEFGFDFGQNPANAAVRAQAQQVPAIGQSVLQSLSSWAQAGGKLACWYNLSYQSGNSGDWGLVEDIFNPSTPKYQAVSSAAPLMWWDDSPLPVPAAPQPTPTPAPVQTPPLFAGTFKDGAKTYNVSVTAA